MRTSFLIATAVVALSTPAYADTISVFSPLVTQNAFDSTGNMTLSVANFDPSLGTLTAAALTLDAFTGPQFEVLNVGNNNVGGTGVGSTTVTYSIASVGLSGSVSSGTQTVTVTSGLFDLASSTPSPSFIDPSASLTDLAALTGAGTTGFDVNQTFTTSGTTITPNASLAFGGGASANLELEVTYTFTPAPAPEPVSIALLGSGLVGLSLVRRRRRS
jgi:PEP-CTERM motif